MMTNVDTIPAPCAPVVDTDNGYVTCVACGAGVSGPEAATVARGLGWVELPGVHVCPACARKPEVWASVGVEVSDVSAHGSPLTILRFLGHPIMGGGDQEEIRAQGVALRSALASFVAAAMTAARRG